MKCLNNKYTPICFTNYNICPTMARYTLSTHGKEDVRGPGTVLWIPTTIGELIRAAGEQPEFLPCGSGMILTEDADKILDADWINDVGKLYLVSETNFTNSWSRNSCTNG